MRYQFTHTIIGVISSTCGARHEPVWRSRDVLDRELSSPKPPASPARLAIATRPLLQNPLIRFPQFDRNAAIGSIRDAFQAGIYPARAATAVSSIPIPANVAGSPDVTPNSRLPSPLDRARDAAIPNASPKPANPNVRRTIRLRRVLADAPSAIRIPISLTRWRTEYEITA